jgi:pantoate--beta-alanine ligase
MSKPTIPVFRDVSLLRTLRKELLLSDKSVGLVPTMGALHEGHLALIRRAASENPHVFVSIFVNPTQFGVTEDLASYPRTWDTDMAALSQLDEELAQESTGRIAGVFAPTSQTMYPVVPPTQLPDGPGTFVSVSPISSMLEGASRPTFFRGVATVCTKLFNIVTPDKVYFGQKDIQQTVVIRRIVKDLHMNTEVVIVPTIREPDGLAMSSRNVYLGERRRNAGLVLSQSLRASESQYLQGKTSRADILDPGLAIASARQANSDAPFDIDYIKLVDPDTMEAIEVVDIEKGAILCGAIKMHPVEPREGEDMGLGGGAVPVRLIDNLILPPRFN